LDDTETASGSPQQKAAVRASPQLMTDVRQAIDGGVNFLTRHFGIGGEGAMPTPDDGAARQAGMQRFASGEGAATPEELEGVDDKIDPNRELDEGQRQMVRLAKTMRWYQARGRKDEAEAAAASYMQYGANRFSKLGTLAETAYNAYLQSNDPKDLDKTAQIIEQAYAMVPDGAEVDIRINEKTGRLEATHVDEDGDETFTEVDPNDIPGLLKGVRDKSMYWDSIFRLADPEGAKSKDIEERAIRTEQRAHIDELGDEGRADVRKQDEEKRSQKQKDADYERDLAQKKLDDKAAADADVAKEVRQAQAEQNKLLFQRALDNEHPKPKEGQKNMTELGPLLAAAAEAKAAYGEDDSQENKVILDTAASRLYDAVNGDDKWMLNNGFEPGEFQYTAAGGAPTGASAAGLPAKPEGYDNAVVKKRKDGTPVWAIPDPDRPGKFKILETS